jgi:hypothetical protein
MKTDYANKNFEEISPEVLKMLESITEKRKNLNYSNNYVSNNKVNKENNVNENNNEKGKKERSNYEKSNHEKGNCEKVNNEKCKDVERTILLSDEEFGKY